MGRETDLVYMAGIIDGEGSFIITLNNERKSYHLVLSVQMCHEETILKIYKTFGAGSMYIGGLNEDKCAVHWTVKVSGKSVAVIAKALLPYLITKKTQALLAIKFAEECIGPRKKKLTEEQLVASESYYFQMKKLNKRGPK